MCGCIIFRISKEVIRHVAILYGREKYKGASCACRAIREFKKWRRQRQQQHHKLRVWLVERRKIIVLHVRHAFCWKFSTYSVKRRRGILIFDVLSTSRARSSKFFILCLCMKIIRGKQAKSVLCLFCTTWPTSKNSKTLHHAQSSILIWRFRCSSRSKFLKLPIIYGAAFDVIVSQISSCLRRNIAFRKSKFKPLDLNAAFLTWTHPFLLENCFPRQWEPVHQVSIQIKMREFWNFVDNLSFWKHSLLFQWDPNTLHYPSSQYQSSLSPLCERRGKIETIKFSLFSTTTT